MEHNIDVVTVSTMTINVEEALANIGATHDSEFEWVMSVLWECSGPTDRGNRVASHKSIEVDAPWFQIRDVNLDRVVERRISRG